MNNDILLHVFIDSTVIMCCIQTYSFGHRGFLWPWAKTQYGTHSIIRCVVGAFVSVISDKLVGVDTSRFDFGVNRNDCLVMIEDMSMTSSTRACATTITATFN